MRKSRINRRKNKNDITKIASLFLISVVALASIGVGYSAWTDTIYIEGTVNTGNVDLKVKYLSSTYIWKDVSNDDCVMIHEVIDMAGTVIWRSTAWMPDEGDILVAKAETTPGPGDDQVTLTIDNIFPLPSDFYLADVVLHYDGSIPVKVNDISWTITSGSDWIQPLIDSHHVVGLSYIYDDTQSYPEAITGTEVREGYQLHQCNHVWLGLLFNLPQSEVYMSQTGSFTITFEVIQWNEYNSPPQPPENNPPYTPSDPDPYNGETGVDVDHDLSWTGGDPDPGDTVTYDVYFGTSSPPSLVVSGQSGTSYDPGVMSYNTQYYWKIVATDNHGASTEGPVWSFTTQPEIPPQNSPPYGPTDPTPANNADYEDVYDVYLECTVSDPDGDSMDVSFYWGGTSIATDLDVPNNGIASIYLPDYIDPDWVDHDITYEWYVVVEDDDSATTTGPTWNFKTCKAWDLNVDRTVDYLDISIMMSHYPETVTPPGSEPWDINNDGEADYLDLSILISHYGEDY